MMGGGAAAGGGGGGSGALLFHLEVFDGFGEVIDGLASGRVQRGRSLLERSVCLSSAKRMNC
eukprot:scaffold5381_cov76-Skeletonema_dohrnii-CCMP3373.AAC.4